VPGSPVTVETVVTGSVELVASVVDTAVETVVPSVVDEATTPRPSSPFFSPNTKPRAIPTSTTAISGMSHGSRERRVGAGPGAA